ncbi:MAG: type II secretion system F family protein [Armatimonadota bacterium]
MPWFMYKVLDKSGKSMMGAMAETSEVSVRQRLVDAGYTIVSVDSSANTRSQTKPKAAPLTTFKASPPVSEMSIFFIQLSTLLKGGITINDALSKISLQSRNAALQMITQRLAEHTAKGGLLSEAMAEYPRAFPQHVIGVVASGELGGFLPEVVGDIAFDYELTQKASTRSAKFWSAIIWVHIFSFLMFIPMTPIIFNAIKELGTISTPGDIGQIISTLFGPFLVFTIKYSIPSLILILSAYYYIKYWLNLPENSLLASKLLLKIPWAGKASKERSLAGFSKILWRLQSAGVLPIQSWEAASSAPANPYIAELISKQAEDIRAGKSFSDALAATGVFNADDQRVLQMAEKAGQVPDALQRMAAYYEDSAMISAGNAKWLNTRIGIMLLILSAGAFIIISASAYRSFMDMIFSWIDAT